MDLTEPLKPGSYVIECLDGKTRTVNLKRGIVSYEGGLLYLEDVNGKHYNFGVVISIQEA